MHHVSASNSMESFIIFVGIVLLLFMFAPIYRVVWGPRVISRILGVNVIGTKTTVLVIIIGTISNQVEMFVDIAIAYAMLNFIASLAAARFFQRHKQMYPEEEEKREKEIEGEEAC